MRVYKENKKNFGCLGSFSTSDFSVYSYPGGMLMPGRHSSSADYRFGYNGMEMDNEPKGNGNSYTTEFRQYDPRLMRWLSLDPLMMKFPQMSPYVAFNNNPIYFTDPLGLEGEGPGDENRTRLDAPSPEVGGEDRYYNTETGKLNQNYVFSGSDNSDWEQKNVRGENTNIIKGLERTSTGGYGSVVVGKNGTTMVTGYICENSENYKVNSYYQSQSFETDYTTSVTAKYYDDFLVKHEVKNTFLIKEDFIYHKQTIIQTRVFFNSGTGEYRFTYVDQIIIEQKQYFDKYYSINGHLSLDEDKFYQKRTIKTIGKVNDTKISSEMKKLIEKALLGVVLGGFRNALEEKNDQFRTDYYEDMLNHEMNSPH